MSGIPALLLLVAAVGLGTDLLRRFSNWARRQDCPCGCGALNYLNENEPMEGN